MGSNVESNDKAYKQKCAYCNQGRKSTVQNEDVRKKKKKEEKDA